MTTAGQGLAGGWDRNRVADVPVHVFEPAGEAVGTVVALSDVEWPESFDSPSLAGLLRGSGLRVVFPESRSWWIDRPDPALTPPRSPLSFIAQELAAWIHAKWPGDGRLAVVGVGFGGQGALQVAYRHPQLFPIVAAIRPAIDFHRLYETSEQLQQWFTSQEQARQETATLRLHPLNWPPHQWFACPRGDWRFDGCERLASKLTSIGIPFEADLETPAGADYLDRQLGRAVEFTAARLREPPTGRGIGMTRIR